MNRRLLLLSSSRDANGVYLLHSADAIRALFGRAIHRVLFIPYASVTTTPADYADRVAHPMGALGYSVDSIHDAADAREAVAGAEAIVVGGGNTFRLLAALYDEGLLGPIRERVAAGVPYLGWSAGSVVASPTIGTTNDMPIVEPRSLRALALIPFQINAHYTDHHPPGHQGETRADRLEEFVAANRSVRVLGLREGSALRITGDEIELLGAWNAPVFAYGMARAEYDAGDDLSFLLHEGIGPV
jgi:dipeptidase E